MVYNLNQVMYPPQFTDPMEHELTSVGFKSIKDPNVLENILAQPQGTTLVVVNSVCGCGARNARPGAIMALNSKKIPANLVTVFAGVDHAAVEKAREHFLPYPPSSPCIALFKDGNLVHFLERRDILDLDAHQIAENLDAAFNAYC